MESDPQQFTNLASQAEHQQRKATLHQQLAGVMKQYDVAMPGKGQSSKKKGGSGKQNGKRNARRNAGSNAKQHGTQESN